MDILWAPWRMKYIKAVHRGNGSCFFCDYIKESKDAANLIVVRAKTCFVILNRYPYNTGHLMIVPKAHKAALSELTDAESSELFRTAGRLQQALDKTLKPHGYNLGINLGRVAGAGVLGHLHLHMVPRWDGDTNFITVTGRTKVMPMSLTELYRILKKAL